MRAVPGVSRAPGSWTELAAGVPELSVTVERRGRWSQHVTERISFAIRDAGLDFVLRFGLGIIRGDVLDVAGTASGRFTTTTNA